MEIVTLHTCVAEPTENHPEIQTYQTHITIFFFKLNYPSCMGEETYK